MKKLDRAVFMSHMEESFDLGEGVTLDVLRQLPVFQPEFRINKEGYHIAGPG